VPLLPNDINRPPTAQPESDEETPDDAGDYLPGSRNGVDDGFFPANRPEFDVENGGKPGVVHQNGGYPTNRRGIVPQNFPYAPEFPNQILPGNLPSVIPDVNVYQHKKTLAQGMMDLALLSANANQLRYVLESYQRHPYYYFSIVFIGLSLIFQVCVYEL
jgi:Ninjurin